MSLAAGRCVPLTLLLGVTTTILAGDPAVNDDAYGEPVRFATQPTRFQTGAQVWWTVAASPDGKWLATTHQVGGTENRGGEVWVWEVATGRVVQTLREPNGGTRCAVFTPDGKTLFTGNFDSVLRAYDTTTWKVWGTSNSAPNAGGHTGGVNGLAITPDGKWLASAGLDNTVRLWSVEEVQTKRAAKSPAQLAPVAIFQGHTSGVFSVAISPDGKTILTGSGDSTARVWDVPKELSPSEKRVTVTKERAVLRDHSQAVEAVAIAPDGKTLVTGSWDRTIRFWDADGRLRMSVTPDELSVLGLAFSRDGKHLAVSTGQARQPQNAGRVHVLSGESSWGVDAELTTETLNKEAYTGAVYSVAFLPDGKTVASAGRDRTLRLRAVGEDGSGRILKGNDDLASFADQSFLGAALSPDGKYLTAAGENKTAVIWDIAERKVVRVLKGHADVVSCVAYSPDGKHIATASYDKTIKLWDAATGKELRTLTGHTNWVFTVAFSPDGNTLASGGYDRTVRLWDLATGTAKANWKEHTAGVRSVAFTNDGVSVVSGSADRTIRIWSVATGKTTATLKGHKGAVRAVVVSPDGTTLASAGEDKTVRVWDLAAAKERFAAVELNDLAVVVRFSPKGHTLLVGTYDSSIVNINPVTGRVRDTLSGGTTQQYMPNRVYVQAYHSDAVTGLLFAPDGTRAYSVGQDKAIFEWKPATPPAKPRAVYRGATGPVTASALSPDGKVFVTGDRTGTVSFWDTATGTEQRQMNAHAGAVTAVAFLADGKRYLTAGADGKVRLWDHDTRGQVKAEWDAGAPVLSAAISPDGRTVAVGSVGKPDVLLYDTTASPSARKLSAHNGTVKAVAFSKDGKTLVSGGADGQLVVWNVADGKELKKANAKDRRCEVDRLAFAPDGKRVAAVLNHSGTPAGNDVEGEAPLHEVVLLDPAAGTVVGGTTFVAQTGITDAAYGADGKHLIVALETGVVQFWDVASKRVVRTINAHADAATTLAVARDGSGVYSGSDDALAKRWDVPIFASYFIQARLFSPMGQVWAAFFSPDGKSVVTGGDDTMIRVRTAIPGEGMTWLQGQYPGCLSVAVSSDEKYLASGHYNGTMRLTEFKTGRMVRQFTELPGRAWTVRFSPDGKFVAASGGEWNEGTPGWAKVWSVADGKEICTLGEHPDTAFSLAYSPDGKRIATGCRDGKVRVFDADGKLQLTIDHGATTVRHVGYTPDGKQLVTGGWDGRVVFWKATTGEQERELKIENGRVNRVVYSRDGKRYAVAYNEPGENEQQTGRVQVYQSGDPKPKHTITDFSGMVLDVAFHPDGITLAAVGGRNNQFPECRFFDVATGMKLAGSPGHKHWVEAITFSPDGSKMISGGGVENQPGEIRIRSTAGLRAQAVLKGNDSGVRCGTFSPDGKLIATGGGDGSVLVLDLAKAVKPGAKVEDAIVKRLRASNRDVRQVLFTRDGKRLLASCEDGALVAWETGTWAEFKTVRAHELPVYGLAESFDGKTLATSAGDWRAKSHGEVKLWDAATLEPRGELPRHTEPVWAVAFAKDGKSLYTTGGRSGIQVYDLVTKKESRRINVNAAMRCLVVSPDGKFVAAAGDGRVYVYDTATWQEVATMTQHQKLILGLGYSSDGRIASASGDGSAIVWKNSTAAATNAAVAAAEGQPGRVAPPAVKDE